MACILIKNLTSAFSLSERTSFETLQYTQDVVFTTSSLSGSGLWCTWSLPGQDHNIFRLNKMCETSSFCHRTTLPTSSTQTVRSTLPRVISSSCFIETWNHFSRHDVGKKIADISTLFRDSLLIITLLHLTPCKHSPSCQKIASSNLSDAATIHGRASIREKLTVLFGWEGHTLPPTSITATLANQWAL